MQNGYHNNDAEAAVVGSILENPELIVDVDLTPDDFCVSNHKQIYDAILQVSKSEVPIDVITVSDYLDKNTGMIWLPVVGQYVIHGQIKSSNIKHYAEIVRKASIARRSAEICERLIESVGSSGESAIDDAIQGLMNLGRKKTDYECSLKEALALAVENIDKVFCGNGDPGIKTGHTDIDEKLGGLHNSDLIVVGARPSMGKTALLLQWAINSGVSVGIVSAEMSREQVASRMIAMEGRVNGNAIRNGKLEQDDWPKITRGTGYLSELKIRINDAPSPHINEIKRQARIWSQKYGMKLLMVDYIQEFKGAGNSIREQMIDVITGLKGIAKELDIPVVALAQVSRAVDQRPDSRPHIGDLQESGKIEQAADQIIMVYRDEVYNQESEHKGTAELIVRKNRHGPVGTIRTVWRGEFMRFEDAQKYSN